MTRFKNTDSSNLKLKMVIFSQILVCPVALFLSVLKFSISIIRKVPVFFNGFYQIVTVSTITNTTIQTSTD